MNRLAGETSPYLLQHAHNPVDWRPWGAEAFEAARREKKPIFLSVGYSTCYWCHVMERESFEDAAVAAEMNRLLICVKVDREEHPDVDQLYMTAVQVMSGQGGWPMSVFLLPDGRPFYGGTYFPPRDGGGRVGFVTLVRAIADAFAERAAEVERTAVEVTDILRRAAGLPRATAAITVDGKYCNELVRASLADYDPRHGGFGGAPKFPRETLLELLLTHEAIVPDADRRRLLTRTLDAMADGGIRDQLGGGFHRYSTDARWLVPHFEIMLYDNAMLGRVYARASRMMSHVRWRNVARGVFDFVLREMTGPGGGFYTALDAETDAREGATYLWTMDEVAKVLGKEDAGKFAAVYGLDEGPNFADPHHGDGVAERNVLYLPRGAEHEGDADIAAMRGKLLAARKMRKQPRLDDKILTSWNGLMIGALAVGGVTLGESRYIAAASKAADFLLSHHRDDAGGLLRTSRGGPAKLAGNLDDYAYLAHGLIELERAGQGHRRGQAEVLADQMVRRFGDEDGAFYFTDAAADELIVRQKLAADSPLPSGNAVAVEVLLALGREKEARGAVAAMAGTLDQQAEGCSALLQAAAVVVAKTGPVEVTAGGSERIASPGKMADGAVSIGVEVGDRKAIRVTLEIGEGYHLNAAGAAEPMVATTVDVLNEDVEVERVEYPEAEEIPGLAGVMGYVGRVAIVVHLARAADAGTRLRLRVAYQACTDRACLAAVARVMEIRMP